MKPFALNENDNTLIDLALREDLGEPFLDITADTLMSKEQADGAVKVISKHPTEIVCCGLPLVTAIISRFTDDCKLMPHCQDGDTIKAGEKLFILSGQQRYLSMAERTILNFMQHLSGIATLTREFVKCVAHTQAKILDTRKTLPGFRHLDKYAVQCGGGVNHRMGLYDAIMIKDNHVDLLGGMEKALNKLPQDILKRCPVIVEARTIDELSQALTHGENKITRLLLDNMNLDELRECVKRCAGKLPTEASGGVNLETVASIAETGVDYISVGMLTHSAGNVDLSMKTA
jgi:nicotinate-nucleotide pyrophosphorylase (carboxylating)